MPAPRPPSPWRRLAAGTAAAVAAVAALMVTVAAVPALASDARGDDVPLSERHLPQVVNAPGTWSDDEEVSGPVAALGIATRTRVDGVFANRQSPAVFAVSAIDGHASWAKLPGLFLDRSGYASAFAVSPDGQWIGWVRPQRAPRRGLPGSPWPFADGVGGRNQKVAGWSVMNTVTGQVRRLEDPEFPWVRGTMADLTFSGDSRYLLTSYETPDQPKVKRSRGHQLVAFDVEDGSSRVVEEPGRYWLPNLGSAPTGVTWARGRTVFRADPVTGDRTSLTLPQNVVTASWGPDDTSFAYVGRPSTGSDAPWPLYAGRSVKQARGHEIDLPSDIHVDEILGWRDATHVVVGHQRSSVHVVDVETGQVERIDLAGYGEQLNAPYLADALWQQPLLIPVEPEGTTDPRRPWQWVSGVLLATFAVVLLVFWRRRGRRTDLPAPVAYDGSTPPLRPLATAATGLVLVLVDLRFQGVDLVPDPVGWGLAAVALGSLQTLHRGFRVAGVAAWLAVIPSLPEWVGVEHPLIGVAVSLALLVVLFAVCTAVMAVSPARRSTAAAVRWLGLGLTAALALAILAASVEGSVGVLVLTVGLADLVVVVWFVVLLYAVAKDVPAEAATAGPPTSGPPPSA